MFPHILHSRKMCASECVSALSDFIACRIAAIFHFYCDHHTDQHFSITAFYFLLSHFRLRFIRLIPSLSSHISFSNCPHFPICIPNGPLLFAHHPRSPQLYLPVSMSVFPPKSAFINLRARHLFSADFFSCIRLSQKHDDANANSMIRFLQSLEKFRISSFFICNSDDPKVFDENNGS